MYNFNILNHHFFAMIIGIPKERQADEMRVAITPKTVQRLLKKGFIIQVESEAGILAGFTDNDYTQAGAQIIARADQLLSAADIIMKVQPPVKTEIEKMKAGAVTLSYLKPAQNEDLMKVLASHNINAIAMDAIPRISRAQKMDVLSSMANIAGYRAVIEAAGYYGRFLNGQITAAGKVDPAKVLVIGAGVAGLAALGAANSMGAIVRAFDTRKEVAEQIQSMGAQFLTVNIDEDGATSTGYSKQMSQAFIDAEMELFRQQAAEVDIIITTAQIPGKPAPKLILKEHVARMKPGSVIIDLAASTGGNCELTKDGEVYTTENGVIIAGKTDPLPGQASQLYSSNLCNLLDDMGDASGFKIDMNDDIIKRAMVTYNGSVNWPPEPLPVSATPAQKITAAAKPPTEPQSSARRKTISSAIWLAVIGGLLYLLGQYAPPVFMGHFTVFVLAVFVGWQVIWNVTHALHTPLMSVTNAISGIIIIGGLLQMSNEINSTVSIIAFVAILIASINIVGGFLVTHRMLNMFKK